MEKPCLNDQKEYPDDPVLSRHLGESKNAWDAFMEILTNEHPSSRTEWRYYKDGSSWLFKVTKKAKTICWVSVWPGLFKTTFYFGDKAEGLILDSMIGKEFKDQFVNGRRFGKIRAITVEIRYPEDLATNLELMRIKELVK